MTREEKIDAFTMKLDGYTWQEIGDKYGITRQCAQQTIHNAYNDRAPSANHCVFPNINKWMRKNCVSQRRFSGMIGTSEDNVSRWLRGANTPRQRYIARILAVTGLPFEVAFDRGEPDDQIV